MCFFWYVSWWYLWSFWYASVCGIVFVVGSVGTFLLFILFLCTIRRHERPWNYWYFVLVLFLAIWWLAVPFIINQRTCFKGGVYLYPSISLAHIWFVLVGVILLFLSLLDPRHQDLDVQIGPRRRVLLVSQEFLDLSARRDASLDGRANGLFSCRRCSLSYRGQVDALGRPHGEGSWADEFFYGECLLGTWVEGVLLGKFQSRVTGRMRHSISCLWIVSGPRVLRHFGRTRESRGSSDAWNPQNFLATPAHGLGGPS